MADSLVADLHVHTTNSDGAMSLDDIPEAATQAGVDAVAVTDHDRLHPELDGPWTDHAGMRLIHGIELRVESPAGRVDLLGYGVSPTDALQRETARLQADRERRGAAIIDRVEDHLGIDLAIEARPGIGRPHIARAIAEATELTVADAFADLIGDDCPCFVPRDVPDFTTGRELLADAAALVALAHPYRYADTDAALALCSDLGAVERFYPYDRAVDTTLLDEAVDRYDLVVTGGSDAHDHTLGRAGLTARDYERFCDAASLPHP